MARTQIMSAVQVERTLSRLAYEIVERNHGAENLVLFGIRTRGQELATTLAATISRVEQLLCTAYPLDITRFRDDREQPEVPYVPQHDLSIADRDVVLVDDVLFTGRTARAALAAVLQYGRPRSIQLAVLIDRGHREYPIQPNYVGRVMPTKHKERVVVEVGEAPGVYIVE